MSVTDLNDVTQDLQRKITMTTNSLTFAKLQGTTRGYECFIYKKKKPWNLRLVYSTDTNDKIFEAVTYSKSLFRAALSVVFTYTLLCFIWMEISIFQVSPAC